MSFDVDSTLGTLTGGRIGDLTPRLSPPADIPRSSSTPQVTSEPVDKELLLESLALAPTLREAIESLLRWAGELCPQSGIRVVWGEERLRECWDRRLGRVRKGSYLWRRAAEQWQSLSSQQEPIHESMDESWIPLGGNGAARCLLWMHGKPAEIHILSQALGSARPIGAIILSRPRRRSLLQISEGTRRGLLVAGASMVFLISVGLIPAPYRVTCKTIVRPVGERVLLAPFEATLLECVVAPGDEVRVGDVLIRLDGRPFLLELESLRADLGHAAKKQSIAMAAGQMADAQLAELEEKQLQYKIQLIEERLAQLEIHSPMNGVIISGDLRSAVGNPFKLGDPLLEIAGLDRIRLELEVPETEIHFVAAGSDVRARLDSATLRALDGQVERIYPEAEIREDRNCFVAHWDLSNSDHWIRPGMKGTAVIYGKRRPLLAAWIRPIQESVLSLIGW